MSIISYSELHCIKCKRIGFQGQGRKSRMMLGEFEIPIFYHELNGEFGNLCYDCKSFNFLGLPKSIQIKIAQFDSWTKVYKLHLCKSLSHMNYFQCIKLKGKVIDLNLMSQSLRLACLPLDVMRIAFKDVTQVYIDQRIERLIMLNLCFPISIPKLRIQWKRQNKDNATKCYNIETLFPLVTQLEEFIVDNEIVTGIEAILKALLLRLKSTYRSYIFKHKHKSIKRSLFKKEYTYTSTTIINTLVNLRCGKSNTYLHEIRMPQVNLYLIETLEYFLEYFPNLIYIEDKDTCWTRESPADKNWSIFKNELVVRKRKVSQADLEFEMKQKNKAANNSSGNNDDDKMSDDDEE